MLTSTLKKSLGKLMKRSKKRVIPEEVEETYSSCYNEGIVAHLEEFFSTRKYMEFNSIEKTMDILRPSNDEIPFLKEGKREWAAKDMLGFVQTYSLAAIYDLLLTFSVRLETTMQINNIHESDFLKLANEASTYTDTLLVQLDKVSIDFLDYLKNINTESAHNGNLFDSVCSKLMNFNQHFILFLHHIENNIKAKNTREHGKNIKGELKAGYGDAVSAAREFFKDENIFNISLIKQYYLEFSSARKKIKNILTANSRENDYFTSFFQCALGTMNRIERLMASYYSGILFFIRPNRDFNEYDFADLAKKYMADNRYQKSLIETTCKKLIEELDTVSVKSTRYDEDPFENINSLCDELFTQFHIFKVCVGNYRDSRDIRGNESTTAFDFDTLAVNMNNQNSVCDLNSNGGNAPSTSSNQNRSRYNSSSSLSKLAA